MKLMQRLARNRMARTGERYTAALRAVRAYGPEEFARATAEDRQVTDRQKFPSTPRDGLDGRHVLSAWETARRRH